MKLDDFYWIYKLVCTPTGQIYVGQTGKPNPCWRWSEHFVELRNGISKAKRLQIAWNLFPSLVHWSFQITDKITGKRAGNYREAERILEIPDHLRLNHPGVSTLSLARQRAVIELLQLSVPYREIKRVTGLSTGMISRIKTRDHNEKTSLVRDLPLRRA